MKRVHRKEIVRAMLMLLCVLFLAMPLTVSAAKKPVKLNRKEVTIAVGKTVQLKVKGTSKRVKWNSSNRGVATVTSKGKVSGKRSGTAVIKAKVGKKTLKCVVIVKAKKINVKKQYVYLTSLKAYRTEGSIGSVDNRTRTDIFGKVYKNYLWSNGSNHETSSKASLTYRLGGKYNTLEGTFFIPTTYTDESHYVSIEGDGQNLYSGTVRGGSNSLKFKISVAGVNDLTITMYGNLNWATTLGEPLLSY